MRKHKTKEFEIRVRQWAWDEAVRAVERSGKSVVTLSETMSEARELSGFVLGDKHT